jgi:hypothetical protein
MPSPDDNTVDFFLSFSCGLWPCSTQFKLLYKLFFLAAQRNHFSHKLLDKKLSCLEVCLLFQLFYEDPEMNKVATGALISREKSHGLSLAYFLRQHNCWHWVIMLHVRLPISLCRNGEVVCHHSAWQEHWNGDEGKGAHARIRCQRAPWLTTEQGARCGGVVQPLVTDTEDDTVKESHSSRHDGRGAEGVLLPEKASTIAAWCGREVSSSVE